MFNVGGPELIVIAVVALIVLGPDKLPGALRQAGQFMGELRRISSGFQTDLRTAIADAERDAEESQRASTVDGAGVDAGRLAAQAELDALEAGTPSDDVPEPADGDPAPPTDHPDLPRD